MSSKTHIKIQKSATSLKKNFEDKYATDEKYRKVRDYCHYTGEYRGAAHSVINLKYCVPKKTLIVFHKGFNFNNHFIIKELAEEFEKQLTY